MTLSTPVTGVRIQTRGAGVTLRNTIVSGNTVNCQGSPAPSDEGTNLQFPGTNCGASIPVARPNLDKLYLPVIGSPALGAGDNPTCVATPVSGFDVYAKPRPQGQTCSIGAAEGDLDKDVADRTVDGGRWPTGIPGGGSMTESSGTGGKGHPQLPECCCCGR